jgi:hypothetical protein
MISPHHSHPTNGVGPSNSNFRIKQYDLVGSNARAAVRRNSAYYSKTDYMICTVGVGCSF